MNWRVLLGGLLGGCVAFGWGSVSWMVLPYHEQTLRPLPMTAAEVSALSAKITQSGVYHWPPMPFAAASQPAGEQAGGGAGGAAASTQPSVAESVWMEQTRKGPRITSMIYHPGGTDPTSPVKYIVTLACYVVAAWIAAWLVWCAGRTLVRYFDRVAAVLGMGVFATLVGVVPHLLWWEYPLEFSFLEVADPLFAWLLAGLVIGGLVVRAAEVPVTVERVTAVVERR